MKRSEILDIFYDIRDNWKNTKKKGDQIPLSVTENGCSEEQFENAAKKFAPGLKMDEIVLFFDNTVSDTGKEGLIFTLSGFYSSDFNFMNKKAAEKMPILYENVSAVKWNEGDAFYTVCFTDGREKRGFGSNYNRFLYLMLSRIASSQSKGKVTSEDKRPIEAKSSVIYEAVPEKLAKVSKVSQEKIDTVIGSIQDRQDKKEKKSGLISTASEKISDKLESLHGKYISKIDENKRAAMLRIFFIAELMILAASLMIHKDPAGLFSEVYGCTTLGSLLDLFTSIMQKDFSSFIGYGNYMMSGISCLLLALLEMELEDLKVRRFRHFLHVILFTYTSGLALAYIWKGLKAIYSLIASLGVLRIPMFVIALAISAVLILLALEELISNLKDIALSVLFGMFFMIGLATILSLLAAPIASLFALIFKSSFPKLVPTIRAYIEALSGALSHPASLEVMNTLRVTFLCGYGVVKSFRWAWKDVRERRNK